MIKVERNLFFINTDHTSYIMRTDDTGHLLHVHYGARIEPDSVGLEYLDGPMELKVGDGTYYDEEHPYTFMNNLMMEYSLTGKGDTRESAAEIRYDHGVSVIDPVFVSAEVAPGKSDAPGASALAGEGVETLTLRLKDTEKDISIDLNYTCYEKEDVVLRSAEVRNGTDADIELTHAASLMLDLPDPDWEMITLDGAWARERMVNRKALHPGIMVNDSKLGATGSEHNSFVALVRPDTGERHGEAIGCNLIWSGDHSERVEVSPFGKVRLLTGISPYSFRWPLHPGQSFMTPEAVLTWSDMGLEGMRGNMHSFVSSRIIRGRWRTSVRPILINNWEATYFDFDDEKLFRLADTARTLGFELMVLDDGWFGKRNDDTTSLGDWFVNEEKLEGGVKAVADRVHEMGMLFGLWFEPEMVSFDSEMYRRHPEWMVRVPGRKPSPGRHQYLLDFTRKECVDEVWRMMEDVIATAGVDYVKWDMNRNMSDVFSSNVEDMGMFRYLYIQGVYSLMDRMVKRFPDLLFENCSSGGNRYDLGMLCYSPQIWASDNTDATSRIQIGKGTLMGYPVSTMSCHVSDSPNQQTLRVTDLETRFDVASMGVLGYELDLTRLSDEEKEMIASQISFYKEHRKTFQFGRFHLLRDDGDATVWAKEGEDETIVVYFQYVNRVNTGKHACLCIPYLEKERNYRITERPRKIKSTVFKNSVIGFSGRDFRCSGNILAGPGVNLPPLFYGRGMDAETRLLGDWSSFMLVIRAEG